MCSSKTKVTVVIESSINTTTPPISRINGRPVLQPNCNNHVPNLERRNSIKKITPPPKSLSPPPLLNKTTSSILTPPISPIATKRGNDNNALNLSYEKIVIPKNITMKSSPSLERKKSKSFKEGSIGVVVEGSLSYCSSLITESPGSIAAGRREQVALMQAQRKMKIAHYGRSKSAKFERVVPIDPSITTEEEKRCSFITPNSGI